MGRQLPLRHTHHQAVPTCRILLNHERLAGHIALGEPQESTKAIPQRWTCNACLVALSRIVRPGAP